MVANLEATPTTEPLFANSLRSEESVSMDFQVCQPQNYRVHCHLKSGRTLHSKLTKVKDTLPLGKQSNVV